MNFQLFETSNTHCALVRQSKSANPNKATTPKLLEMESFPTNIASCARQHDAMAPMSSNSERDSDGKKRSVSWTDNLNSTDWSHYTDPRTVIPTLLLTTTILVSVRLYRSYLARIPEATYIRPRFFRNRSLFGKVTRVGDADNFHLFHTPGGRLAGWEWAPGRKIPDNKGELKNNTVGFSPMCSTKNKD